MRLQALEEAWLLYNTEHYSGRRPKKKARASSKPLYRTKSSQLVVEIDNALKCRPFGGPGLVAFQAPDNWKSICDERCLEWRTLVGSLDQGPDCWCAQNWMEDDGPHGGHIVYYREPDAHNHGVHNDVLNAALECGMGSLAYGATTLAANAKHYR